MDLLDIHAIIAICSILRIMNIFHLIFNMSIMDIFSSR